MGIGGRMNEERNKIEDEMDMLERHAYEIVKSLVRYNYSFSSMLYFASRIQWLIFNVELVRRDMGLEDKKRDEMMKEIMGSRKE